MERVAWENRPELRRPVLVAAFEGWNDAADAATTAARYLGDRWGARRFASVDPEEYFDFTSTRPQVRLGDGFDREIVWPANHFLAASVPEASRDVVVLLGTEPQLRWRTFCADVACVAGELGVELVLTMGALLADVPHTRPVRVSGTAADPELAGRLGLRRSRYEGPTGIVGVLHDAFARARLPSASLWAAVPHYVPATPSPKAALALVERAASLLDTAVVTADLAQQAADYEREVSQVVDADDEVSAYVRRLETRLAEDDVEPAGDPIELVTGDSLAAEVERYLRERGR